MKAPFKILTVLALALTTVTAFAQHRKGNMHKKDRMEKLADYTPQEIAQLKTKRLTLALDLTPQQQAQIQPLILQQATEHKAKMEERKALKEKGDLEKPSKEQRLAMMNERLDKQIAHKAKMKQILNEEQYQRFEKITARKGKGKKGMRRGKGRKRGEHHPQGRE